MKRKKTLMLYVYTDFCPDYTGGLAFAIATSKAEAKNLIAAKCDTVNIYDWGVLHVLPLTEVHAFCVLGGS